MKITRRQIEDAFVESVATAEERIIELGDGKANKVFNTSAPPPESGGLDLAAVGQRVQTLAFDTGADMDGEESFYQHLHTPEDTFLTVRQGALLTTAFDDADLEEIMALFGGSMRFDPRLETRSRTGNFVLKFSAVGPAGGSPGSRSIRLIINDGVSETVYVIYSEDSSGAGTWNNLTDLPLPQEVEFANDQSLFYADAFVGDYATLKEKNFWNKVKINQAESMGYIALSGGRRLNWDGARFALQEESGGAWNTLEVFYDRSLPAGSRWLAASYAFAEPVAITEVSFSDRAGPWVLTQYAYQPAAVTTTLDFPEHVADHANPHGVTAAQAGTYTAQEIDDKDGAVANMTYYYRAYWFGRRDSSTPWPLPEAGETWEANARNGFDFETNTPWIWDGSAWVEEAAVPAGNGTVIGISSSFLDITEAGYSGLARYSEEDAGWDYYPDKYNSMDPLIFEKNAAGQETIKNGSIQASYFAGDVRDAMLQMMIPPGRLSHEFLNSEADAAQWRLIPADGRTISVADPRCGRLLQYCEIDYAAANDNANIKGFYRTDDNWANGATAAASGKTRATPAASGAYFAIPDARGLFLRGAGVNAFDALYDGGAIGSVEGFGSMGPPDFDASGLTTGNMIDPLNIANANTGTYVMPEDGYLDYRLVDNKNPQIDAWARVNGILAVDDWIQEVPYNAQAGLLPVKKGDIVTYGTHWGSPYLSSWIFFIPQARNKGSISTAVYMSY